jgi:hypothetical protein
MSHIAETVGSPALPLSVQTTVSSFGRQIVNNRRLRLRT